MAETTTPGLMAAAKEFNIGKDTLVDFLAGKGFSRDDLKPTAKLTEDMYRALQLEFQSDKVAKLKSDQIDLPKGSSAETRKRKEDEAVLFKKETKKPAPVEEVKIPEPIQELVPEVTKQEVKIPEPEPIPEPVEKIEVPELTAPKVLDKIDLSTIDSSTRPKKSVKKPKQEKPKETAREKTQPLVEKQEVEEIDAALAESEAELPPMIENIKADKLEGPKILGKIQLPVDSETRPKPNEEKRKRKRIPIEKKQPDARLQREGFNRENRPAQGGGFRRDQQRPEQRKTVSRASDRRTDQRRPIDKEIDQKEIQNKIRETQAKLAGAGGRGKSLKAKHRRARREEMAEQMGAEDQQDNVLQLTEFISVSELANLMDVNYADVISKCMSLGLMVSINQRLDAEVIELVANEFGYQVEFVDMEKQTEMEEEVEEDDESDLQSRSPIVTIMGHVDHGKTSLLDYIRSANVVAGEAGGITQHVGAYQVELPSGKEITFLDTPGHEAFTAMRARGAKVTDIAVIVIAADDAVMPQTKEAISHAQAAGVPMIFAVNKIDKDGANPQKIYEQLAGLNLLVESWGGKYQSQEISAKQGLNVDLLLEKILLEAEILDLKANPDREASGTIIEASLDKGRGYVATILVQNGTLQNGDLVVSGQHYGRVKAMFNERGKRVDIAPPSTPVLILGLNGAPQAGEKFKVYEDEAEAKDIANHRAQILREQGMRAKKHITLDEIGRRLALGNFKELK